MCKTEKPLEAFAPAPRSKTGRHSYCRPCMAIYRKAWNAAHPGVQQAAKKRWEAEHPEEVKAAKRRRYNARKAEMRELMRQRRAAEPERYQEFARSNRAKRVANGKDFAYRILKEYDLTVEQYNALMISQNGACPICKRSFDDARVRKVVDHCHETGRVRGLLCNGCNLHLGWFEGLRQATLDYLG